MTIKHESITVDGTVIYCDGCGARGPEEAYDNANDVIEEAIRDGWRADGDRDLCPTCAANEAKASKGTRASGRTTRARTAK